jgi:hypothetical protein
VWAAGDVTGSPQFVYVSAYQGALLAENALLGADREVDLSALPRVTFTAPPVASVGVTEAAATAAGHQVKNSVLPLDAVPRALVNRDTAGVVKLVADAQTDRLLGVTVVADAAGEVIRDGHGCASLLPTDRAGLIALVAVFRALADPARLRLVEYLREESTRSPECVDPLGLSQARVSTHLACRAGLRSRRCSSGWSSPPLPGDRYR